MRDKEIVFVHTSDWHLGYEQYQKIDRAKDFTDAVLELKKAVLNMNPKPDFILHTGDIFHHFRPSALAFRTAYNVFEAFKKQGIPVIVIRGNHDAPISRYRTPQGDYLYLLKEMGLVNYLTTSSPVINLNNDVSIMGVGFFGKRTSSILQKTFEKHHKEIPPDNLKILMTHALVEGQLPNDYELTIQELASYKFDYNALGHYHLPWKREKWNLWVSGSTEQTASNQWIDPYNIRNEGNICKYGSYLVVKARRNEENEWVVKPEYQKIPIRWKIIVNKEIKGKTAREIEEKIKETIAQTPLQGSICQFKFKIHGSSEKLSELTNQNNYADLLNKAFHSSLKFEFTQDVDYSFVSSKMTEKEIISNYVSETVEEQKQAQILELINYFLNLGETIVEGIPSIPSEEEQLLQIKKIILQTEHSSSKPATPPRSSQPKKEAAKQKTKTTTTQTSAKPAKTKKKAGKKNPSIDEFFD